MHAVTRHTAQHHVDPRTLAFREWIADILTRKGITRTELARKAGLSHSTLSRATSDDDYRINFRADTIAKIAMVGGIRPPAIIAGPDKAFAPSATPDGETPGLSEPQATLYMGTEDEALPPGQSHWLCKSPVLSPMGLMPGDHFILDQNATPRLRDMIMVQDYDHASGSAETLLRLYVDGFAVTPLYLVDQTPRIWLDGGNAACMGVIIKSWRTREG